MPTAALQLVGRDEELRAIVRFLDAPEHLPGAVVLPGEAGIGKTTLWLAGIEAASARGYRILSSRPSGAETRFSYSGLSDLLEDAEHVVAELPPIQRRALEAALLLGDSEVDVDDRTVAAAFLAVLRLLARVSALCVAVDDVQWLDAASRAVVGYALARLEGEPVVALLSVRGEVPEWLRRAVPEDRLRAVDVAGLSLGATHELLRARLDATFPRPTLIRLWETARGNPFFALELATTLQTRGGTLAPGDELPIPTSLDEILHARIDFLSRAAREVAGAVAALADPTVVLLEASLGARCEPGLAEALDARILELDGASVRFTHPLLGSAVVKRQTPGRRRSLHARLAEVVPSAEERARHLALATTRADSTVASMLEDAADALRARGAPGAAAELADEALRLTPPGEPDESRRRLLAAADLYGRAGNTDRAVALLEGALAMAAAGPERATVLTHLADVPSSITASIGLYRDALAEAGDDAALQATINLRLATLTRWSEGAEQGFAHSVLAVRAASRADDDTLRCRALAAHGDSHFRSGRGIPVEEMEEALAIERSLPGWPLHDGPTRARCEQLCWSADPGARAFLQTVRAAIATQDDPAVAGSLLWFEAVSEWRAGNWEEADRCAVESFDLFTQLGRLHAPYELPAALIAAHRGRLDDARARAEGAFARAVADGLGVAQSAHGWVLGFIELSAGDTEAALAHLRQSYEIRNAFFLEPAARLELGDLLEALIATGELAEAEGIITTWEERAGGLDRAWALAILARCRGLLLAARGDLDGAFASFERALAEHARSGDPFHHARTLLALGRTQRRAKKRGAARTTLEDALARFEQLGAPRWAEQTRAELARIGGRSRSNGELTEAERRIALLVAEGRTNREVAAALFLTVHSVETTLTRVYRKLEVRSRAELAHLFAANS